MNAQRDPDFYGVGLRKSNERRQLALNFPKLLHKYNAPY